jgi:glucosamine 6-phosphate synthetase-like amidotransferase/phosphosugar isomerase protein
VGVGQESGALEIKEMRYLHAEGYSRGSLKYRPFVESDENGKKGATPIIAFIFNELAFRHEIL